MRHLRWIPPADWPQEEDPETGELRDVPVRGGMVHGMVLLGEHPDGGWLFDLHRDREGLPGFKISEGPHRYRAIRPAEQTVAWRQAVWRGEGLRSAVLSDLGRSPEPGGPPRSREGRGRPRGVAYREPDDEDARARARELAAREDEPGPIRLRVPLREVRDEDVVDGLPEHGARWAGEPGPEP